MTLLDIWRALRSMPPVVVELVTALVRAIASSPDQEEAARRALEEVTRLNAFDRAMRATRKQP